METEPSLGEELDRIEPLESESEARVATMRRLHPLSPLFEIGRSFFSLVVPGLVVLLLAAGDRYEVWYMALFVPAVLTSLIRYFTKRYELTEDHIVVREGLVFKSTRHIPYPRVQNIDTVQNPLHRLFGVVEVRLETASGQEPEAIFRVLSIAKLDEIRDGVFARRRSRGADPAVDAPASALDPAVGDEEAAPVPEHAPSPPSSFFRMRPLDVAYFGFLSQKGIALFFGLLFLVWEFDLWDRLRERLPFDPEELPDRFSWWHWGALGLALLLVLQALTVVWAFVTLHDFHIARVGDDLRTTCGLWTRQTATLPRQRIQFLQVRQGWLQRRFGKMAVRALTAGGDSTSESQVSRKWLVPIASATGLRRILREVQPELELERRFWTGVHPRARRRLFFRWWVVSWFPVAILARDSWLWAGVAFGVLTLLAWLAAGKRARRLGFSLGRSAVYMRDGVLTHVRNAVRFTKIQSVSVVRSPFDKRHGMATVRVDTAGNEQSELSFHMPYLRLPDAIRLARSLRREAASTRFTW